MRLSDDTIRHLSRSKQARIQSMAKEILEARERGLMPTVDLAAQLSANRIPVDMKDGTYIGMPKVAEGVKVVERMNSGPGVDQLIRLLAEYRGEVWPNYKGVSVRG